MRQKIAKALAREAREFAEANNRTNNVLSVHRHPVRYMKQAMEELNRDGTMKFHYVPVESETFFLSDGPRCFKQTLKKAFKKGLLER